MLYETFLWQEIKTEQWCTVEPLYKTFLGKVSFISQSGSVIKNVNKSRKM